MRSSTDFLVPGSDVRIEGRPDGPLSGLTFVAKDLFDIAGRPTGAGNHDWAHTHAVPDKHAWVVQTLLDHGATLIGKTITDEISLGILGENMFDGTPTNPAAPDRVPGGSSSGSVSAVAQGFCDFALGTDTGGSVRVPASFCGVYGIRPTHGRLPVDGMLPQAPTSDTTGWFARDADTFARVASGVIRRRQPRHRQPKPTSQKTYHRNRCPWLCRPGCAVRTGTHDRPARKLDRRCQRGSSRPAGPLGLGPHPAHVAAL